MKPFIPNDFTVPLRLEHPSFTIRPLLITDVIKDYDAVMTSLDHLQGVFGDESNWPSAELTLEQDLIDLGWHHKEFQRRSSFAYTVMAPDETQCRGCLYIYPDEHEHYDAKIYCWIRASHAALDQVLFETLKDWIKSAWPFAAVRYPVRETAS